MKNLTAYLSAWACLLVVGYVATLSALSPIGTEEREGLAALFATVGLVPPAIYAYWPRR